MSDSDRLMNVTFVSNGDPKRIPEIGARLYIQDHLFFKVEKYGESKEVDGAEYGHPGPAYEVELLGCLVIPAGSPMSVLENLLGVAPEEVDEDE